MTFHPGDLVRIRRDASDHWCRAEVREVSPDSISLMVSGVVRAGSLCIAGHFTLSRSEDQFLGMHGDHYMIEPLLHHHEP